MCDSATIVLTRCFKLLSFFTIIIENGQPRELALCQLYRRTFVPYYVTDLILDQIESTYVCIFDACGADILPYELGSIGT